MDWSAYAVFGMGSDGDALFAEIAQNFVSLLSLSILGILRNISEVRRVVLTLNFNANVQTYVQTNNFVYK